MPNSFLWIGLVAVWLFVLFPMLADRHPRIRQTADAALSTRVLHRGGSRRRPARGPATGHDSDPNWQRATADRRTNSRGIEWEDPMDTRPVETDLGDTNPADTNPEYPITRDIAHDGAMPADVPRGDAEYERADHPGGDVHDRDHASEVAAVADDWAPDGHVDTPGERSGDRSLGADRAAGGIPPRRGRGGFDPEADAIARAARYRFRQRAVLGLLLASIMSAAVALITSTLAWWVCGVSVAMLVAYLSYLRRQVRMEEEIRRRRMARVARARLGVESKTDAELRLVPARLRRPGAVVVEVDDEDPAFEHLDHPVPVMAESEPVSEAEMRAASGQ
jgi:hypothetical protein